MTTDKGVRIDVRSELWFDRSTTSPSVDQDHGADVHVAVRGRTTLTNRGSSVEAAAGSVLYEYNAGWPVASSACRLLRAGSDPATDAGGYCWLRLGTASLLDPQLHFLVRLRPGETRTIDIDADPVPAGLSADVPAADAPTISRALQRPDVLVVTTSDALQDSEADRFRNACEERPIAAQPATGHPPVSAGAPPAQHVIVASTTPLTCSHLPPVSN